MSQDTKYQSYPMVMANKGIFARFTYDRPPGEAVSYYLNLDSVEEREEQSISSRYGSVIINRDPLGIGTNNYPFLAAPNTITRLVSGASTWRYVGVSPHSAVQGTLFRRATDTQGVFSLLAPTGIFGNAVPLSGNIFSSLVTPCYQSAQPYLFIADSLVMLKESGAGNPVSWGVPTPSIVANTLPYGLGLGIVFDTFQSTAGFTTSGFTITGLGPTITVNGTGGTLILSEYEQYACGDKSSSLAQDGMVGVSVNTSQPLVKWGTLQDTTQFNVQDFAGSSYHTPDSFQFISVQGTVAANSVGSIGKNLLTSAALGNLSADALLVLVIQLSSPSVVQEVRLQMDVNHSGYTTSYYYKSLAPAAFQNGVSSPQTTSPGQAVTNEVSGRAGAVVNAPALGVSSLPASVQKQIIAPNLPTGDPFVPRLQPTQLSTGANSWSVIYIRKGEFLPVGNAGEPGLDWFNITGWQIQVITNTQGSTSVGLNGYYVQDNGGPSSYGGVGYDYRYTYFDAVTNTEGNPCGQQYFPITPSNPAGVSLLFPLRQSLNVTGQYSANPRVSHVRIYRRGGVLPGPDWLLVDKIPNSVGTGTFSYRDSFSDQVMAEQPPLNLANDPPVTSTLQNPIVTTLSNNITPTAPFGPTTINVASGTAHFVPGQIVDVGNLNNLEQVVVVTGGTGSFTGVLQLAHVIGEPVQVFSLPYQPCNLCALAYNQVWLAGDPNNPHLLYFSEPGFPENFPPQNYIPVTNPSDPIMAVINFRGTLFCATKSTWYQIYPSNPPVAQPTGSKHGLAASFGWTQTESAIWYQAFDGIREFNGADGAYKSALIEWLYQNQPQAVSPSPVPALNQAFISQVLMAYWNNRIFIIYPGVDGNNHRLIYDLVYSRWHNDDLYVNAINLETDTNTLVIARVIIAGTSQSGANFCIAQDQVGDYDDRGYIGSNLTKTPISFTCQTPYYDQGKLANPKQYNMFTVDANPNSQELQVELLFDDPASPIPSITLPLFTGTQRQKFNFVINAGFGQPAYRCSAVLTGSVIAAPIIYQMELEAAELAEQLASYDTYWLKFGTDQSKLVKQGYFDYTSTQNVTVALYADGNTTPYYTFTLPPNPTRSESPTRIRFLPMKLRQFRIIALSSADFQFWAAPQIDWKPVIEGKGYEKQELLTT